ncbi:Serine/threonine-protein kinase gad8 [Trichoderma lentiforme]|uniref:non-specific serine/threonine protein kinase n=1 Tax=Trichoderma lentiforme TaxID=1567552 RepID=A0A9P4X8R6_9HYPO|nr:Serine/threonine-protein kinase gad8 [Trichoderma lentiforme]
MADNVDQRTDLDLAESVLQTSILEFPGILIVTLHEAAGLSKGTVDSEPDGYEEYSDNYDHNHTAYKGLYGYCLRCKYPQTLVEYDKCQIPLTCYWGTTENPSWHWGYGICKFYVTRPSELLISFYHPTGSKFKQAVYLGSARARPFNASGESMPKWLPIEDGIGMIRISYDYTYMKNKASKETEFDGQFYGVERKSSGCGIQNTKGKFEAMYAGKHFETDKLFLSQVSRGLPSRINHPFICPTAFYFELEGRLQLNSPLAIGGHLFNHLLEQQYFGVDRSRFYIAEILCALEYLHDKQHIFAWLKPRSVLLDGMGHIALCGFGLFISEISHGSPRRQHRLPEYPAPELLLGQNDNRMADWWTLGIFLYEMLTGLPLFYDEDPERIADKILNQTIEVPESLPRATQDIITGLLCRNPKQRLGAKGGVSEVKAHPFFMGIDWHTLIQRKYQPSFKPSYYSSHLEHHGVVASHEPPPSPPFLPFNLNRMYPEHRSYASTSRTRQVFIQTDNNWDLIWEDSHPQGFHFYNRATGEKQPIIPQAVESITSEDAVQANETYITVPDQRQKLATLKAALQAGYDNAISQLLEYGVNLNVRMDKWRETPLLWVAQHENLSLVKLFLENGADANYGTYDLDDKFALIAAVRTGNQQIAEVLLEKSRRVICTIALSLAIDQNDGLMAKLLLENGVRCEFEETDRKSPYEPDPFETTTSCEFPAGEPEEFIHPLFRAVVYGNEDMVRLLLSYGADANVGYHGLAWYKLKMDREERIKFECGRVIHVAMELRQHRIVELLLENGADINLGRPIWDVRTHNCKLVPRDVFQRVRAGLRAAVAAREEKKTGVTA